MDRASSLSGCFVGSPAATAAAKNDWLHFLRPKRYAETAGAAPARGEAEASTGRRKAAERDGHRRSSPDLKKLDGAGGGEAEARKNKGRHPRSASMTMAGPQQQMRRPSIPSSIDGDCSVVSALTLATYSEEKAEYVRREFLCRYKQRVMKSKREDLSPEEKQELLMELQAEVESKFKSREDAESRSEDTEDDLERLLASKKQDQEATENKSTGRSSRPGPTRSYSRPGPSRRHSCDLGDSFTSVVTTKRRNSASSARGDRAARSSLVATAHETTKQEQGRNSSQGNKGWQSFGLNWRPGARAGQRERPILVESEEASSNGASSLSKPRLEEIIELKLLVAEQQAAIDTLSSNLRGLELANRRQLDQGLADASRIEALEDENRDLARQLAGCREREISLRKEARDGFRRRLDLEGANVELADECEALRRTLGHLQDGDPNGGGSRDSRGAWTGVDGVGSRCGSSATATATTRASTTSISASDTGLPSPTTAKASSGNFT